METIKQIVAQAAVFQDVYLSDLPMSQKIHLLIGSNISSDFEELYDILGVEPPDSSEDSDEDLQFLDYVYEESVKYLKTWKQLGKVEDEE